MAFKAVGHREDESAASDPVGSPREARVTKGVGGKEILLEVRSVLGRKVGEELIEGAIGCIFVP